VGNNQLFLLVYVSSTPGLLRVGSAAAGTRLSEYSTGACRFTGVIDLIQLFILGFHSDPCVVGFSDETWGLRELQGNKSSTPW
jgi:hypothetical protein